ncbi:MAG: hypothetical protein YYHSYBAR_001567 [Candidatus Fervidibacter sacchari]|jgi:hypothetical protein
MKVGQVDWFGRCADAEKSLICTEDKTVLSHSRKRKSVQNVRIPKAQSVPEHCERQNRPNRYQREQEQILGDRLSSPHVFHPFDLCLLNYDFGLLESQ